MPKLCRSHGELGAMLQSSTIRWAFGIDLIHSTLLNIKGGPAVMRKSRKSHCSEFLVQVIVVSQAGCRASKNDLRSLTQGYLGEFLNHLIMPGKFGKATEQTIG